MNENKMPQIESVEELMDLFDSNDMSEYFDAMPEVHCDVDIQRRSFLVSVDKKWMKKLAQKLAKLARAQHTSTEQLVNSWLEEKTARAA